MQRNLEESNSKIIEHSLLFLILLVTFILSVKQMYPLTSFDEVEMMNWAKGLEGDFFPARKFPPLFLYLHFFLSWIYRGVLSLLGIINTTSGFLDTELGFRFTMEAGRVVSALFAVLTVLFSYKTGKEFYNTYTGFAAALLMACNPLVILYAHIFRPDIMVTLVLTICLYWLLKYLQAPNAKHLFLAAFFYGLSVAGKFNVFTILAAIGVAVLLARGKKNVNHSLPVKKVQFYLPLGAAAGFFAGAPNWLVNPMGNIQRFLMQYGPEDGMIYKPYAITSPLGTYGDIAADLIHFFGLIFFLLLVAGMLSGFISGNKNDIVISSFILSYFILFGFFGFYASRYGLPPYPAIALIMAKVLFTDLEKLVQRFRQGKWLRHWRRYAAAVLWALLVIHALINTAANVKDYNLLKTQLLWDYAQEYRQQHNILDKRFNVGRQIYTPKIPKRNIKLTKKFYLKFEKRDKNKPLHFVQAHLSTYEDFIKDPQWQSDPRAIKLDNHRPFFRIRKRGYQPWHPESVFLYHVPPALKGITPAKPLLEVPLPRTFYKARHTTFLPLQIYEKNPTFGKLDSGLYHHWLHAAKKIEKIVFHLFSLQQFSDLTVSVNNREIRVKNKNRPPVETIEIENLKSLSFYHDYVYSIEIEAHDSDIQIRSKPFYFTVEPIYGEEQLTQSQSHRFNGPLQGEIPRLFSSEPWPEWVKQFYRQTGIDLALLTHLSTVRLFTNTRNTLKDISIDVFPLERGSYFIRLEGEKILPQYPLGESLFLEYTCWSIKGPVKKRVKITAGSAPRIPVEVNEPLAFVKIGIKGMRQNNYLIKRVSLVPDYRKSFSSH
jgi:hypothetical protein